MPRSATPETVESLDQAAPGSLAGDDLTVRPWLVRIGIVVAVFFLIGVARSIQVGIDFRDPHGAIFTSRIAITVGLILVWALIQASWWTRHQWSVRAVGRVLRARWSRRRIALVAAGTLAYYGIYWTYHNLKSWDVFNRPRDSMLLQWDRVLFLGHDPASLLHSLLGTHWSAYVLMVVYEAFSTIVTVAVPAALVLPYRIRESFVFVAGALWVWILGTLSYYAIPSLGPFDVAPQLFSHLPHTMIQDTQATYMGQRAHLLAHPHEPHAFAQVSAFASLHIGVSSFLLLMAHYYRMRRTTIVMTVYVACTIVATVYLGWHFFVDDVAGLLLALASVWLGRRMMGAPRRTPEAAVFAPDPDREPAEPGRRR